MYCPPRVFGVWNAQAPAPTNVSIESNASCMLLFRIPYVFLTTLRITDDQPNVYIPGFHTQVSTLGRLVSQIPGLGPCMGQVPALAVSAECTACAVVAAQAHDASRLLGTWSDI